MNKKFTLILLASASCLAASAFSSNGLEKFIKPQGNSASKLANNASAGNFTDFSGTWVGTCTNGYSPTLKIKNTESQLTIEEENDITTKTIGQLESTNDSGTGYTHWTQTLLHWSPDGSQLIANLAVEDQSLNEEVKDSDFFVGKSTYSLSNGQLIIDSVYQSLTNKMNVTCTFKKQ